MQHHESQIVNSTTHVQRNCTETCSPSSVNAAMLPVYVQPPRVLTVLLLSLG